MSRASAVYRPRSCARRGCAPAFAHLAVGTYKNHGHAHIKTQIALSKDAITGSTVNYCNYAGQWTGYHGAFDFDDVHRQLTLLFDCKGKELNMARCQQVGNCQFVGFDYLNRPIELKFEAFYIRRRHEDVWHPCAQQ